MKRLWLVLLSLGLVMAFSVSALAVDVKFSGEYYAQGMYLDRTDVLDASDGSDPSTAFFFQRFRLGTDFIVSPCLKLVTRVDIMERVWEPDNTGKNSVGTVVAQNIDTDARNVDWDIAYINYVSPIGLFQVGYMEDYAWGTVWGNRTTGPTTGQIKYFVPIGPVTMVFAYAKEDENDYSIQYPGVLAEDIDQDSFRVGPIFNFKSDAVAGEAGVLFTYDPVRQYRTLPLTPATAPFKQDVYTIQPYFKAKFGPVAMQGELHYAFGERDYETDLVDDQDINSLSAWLDADANFGMFSVGGSLAYVQGDDDPNEINNQLTGGRDWNPCLIMYNNNMFYTWIGPMAGGNNENVDGELTNAIFAQVRGSVTPIPELTAGMSLSYAQADEDFGGDNDKGFEVDITGTYKITNNLSYMLGFGYLFTGDFYKGPTGAGEIEDDYVVLNKLTLSF
ncbi:MAG: hypothetical protein KBG22_00040 [Smithella sp.]|nr:hypothetical protein [Smithella sp.]